MRLANETLAALRRGDDAVGCWLLSGSPRVAEALAGTAVDWLCIDTEHAPHSPERVEALVRAVEPDATPLVRLPSVEDAVSGGAKRALDAGAQGVVVPGVETRGDAEAVVRAALLPPAGERGVAGTTRANGYGERFDDYVEGANAETLVAVQLETPPAVEAVGDVLAVDGVDVAFVGENDLSAALGRPGETEDPEVAAAVERVREAARDVGVAPGIAARTPAARAERSERGFQFFLLGADLTFARRGVAAFLDG
ncbi:MAG: HpcH/HpaI aldolase/citrate lyase family protein [Halobacteriaceae archaeon]